MSGHLSLSRPRGSRDGRGTSSSISGYSRSRNDVPTAESAIRKRLIASSLVFDRAALWNGWWRARARERLPWPCKSCRNPLAVVESGRWWIPPGSATSLLCPAGESIPTRYWFSARPLSRKRAGRSSNACDVPVCRPPGPGSTSGFPHGFIAAGKWRRKRAEEWACFFGRSSARREPIWADLRLLVTPRAGGQGETRRVNIEVLYRRGGLGGSAQAWEIDHAAGLVRLVPEVADPATANRKARA